MKKSTKAVGLLLAVFSLLFFDYAVFAQPTPGGGGGGGTNTYSAPIYNYIYVPGLKLVIPSVNESNLYLNLLEADPAGKYDIYFETNLAAPSWTDVLQGTNGQTNFVYAFSSSVTGFFRAARTDEPVTNTATITAVFRNDFVSTNLVSATITNGPAARTAILVNSTNFSSAQWLPFSSVPLVLLGTNEGTYEVWFGFVGGDGQTNWTSARVTLDTTPLQLTITSPTNNTVMQPRIQVMGYSSEALSGISYDITNAAGVFTNQTVLVVDQHFDTNLWKFTTNFFQAFDVPLTNGGNKVTLHATDLAGNMTTLTTNFTLDYSSKTNSPVVQLHWPQNGNLIGGDMVTLRGQLDDPTAIITTRLVDTNGVTNIVSGLVERDGKFWMEGVPLNPGTNVVTLTATDAAGNVSVTNINLVQSSVTITIAPVSDDQLNRAITMVAGTIIDPSYSVSVNGVEATVDGSGNWSANDVPINNGGTACFDVTASRSALSSVKQSAVRDKPSIVEIAHYEQQASITAVSPYSLLFQTNVTYIHWDYDLGGTNQTQLYVPPARGGPYSYVKTAIWPTNGQTGTFEYDVVFPDHTNFWSSGGEPLPGIMENCPTRITAYSDVTYTRTAQAKVRLKTGGKATSTRKNLFTISGSAQRVTNPYYPDLAADSPQPVTILPAAISLLGKQLGADGYLHIVLPDNSTFDLTPRVNTQSYYTFNVSAIKHQLQIRANGYPLANDRIRPEAKYCVGQKLNFDAVFVPPVPGLNSASPTWIFMGDYINHHYSDGNGCERYVIAPYWVTQNPTHVWYYNGGKELNATVGMYCAFDNSQTAYPFSRGKFSMYEPDIAFTPVGQAAVHVRRSGLAPVLGIGKSDESDSMTFSVNINSIPQFEGQAIITQLIQRQASIDGIPIPHSLGGGTGGRFDLDNIEIYTQTSLTNKPANPDSNLLGTLNFFDMPGIGIQLASWASCSDHFKTYIRFKPSSGDDNIFVTLGRATWNWSANVLYTGIDPTDLNSWTIQSPTVGGPDFTTTDEFPVWTDTQDNFGF